MPLLTVLIVLIVAGVLLWLVNSYIPMDRKIKAILNAVVVIVVIVWLLKLFGVLTYLKGHTNIKMKNTKQLGIWMDHSNAYLMELKNGAIVTDIVKSEFAQQDNGYDMTYHEKSYHNKEQQQQSDYYKKLRDFIKNYQEVVLFGPTDAKAELFNQLKGDHLFEKIKIEVQQSDQMNENQRQVFVREYFEKKNE